MKRGSRGGVDCTVVPSASHHPQPFSIKDAGGSLSLGAGRQIQRKNPWKK